MSSQDKSAAVVCATGLGDGLLMMIAAHQLKSQGYSVTVYHDQKVTLEPLFEKTQFKKFPSIEEFEQTFKSFGVVLVENDNSARAWHLINLRQKSRLKNIKMIFPTPCKKAYTESDYTFQKALPFATNLQKACEILLKLSSSSKENGMLVPNHLQKRAYPKRIVLHPTSNDPKRNWKKPQFIALAKRLKKEGYTVGFAVSKQEWPCWQSMKPLGFEVPEFATLSETAEYIYQSGYLIGNDSSLGHLASNLGIPTITISGSPKRVSLWRPDWAKNLIATTPVELPSFKGVGFLFRERYWQYFVPVSRVLRKFKQLTQTQHEF